MHFFYNILLLGFHIYIYSSINMWLKLINVILPPGQRDADLPALEEPPRRLTDPANGAKMHRCEEKKRNCYDFQFPFFGWDVHVSVSMCLFSFQFPFYSFLFLFLNFHFEVFYFDFSIFHLKSLVSDFETLGINFRFNSSVSHIYIYPFIHFFAS